MRIFPSTRFSSMSILESISFLVGELSHSNRHRLDMILLRLKDHCKSQLREVLSNISEHAPPKSATKYELITCTTIVRFPPPSPFLDSLRQIRTIACHYSHDDKQQTKEK